MTSTLPRFFGWLVLAVGMISCSCSSKKTITVTGRVTWSGQDIPNGDILLVPEDGVGNPDPGKIVNGRYTMEATPGRKIVRVFYSRELDTPAAKAMGQREREQVIPLEYNHESKLFIEVKPGQKNEFDFHLPMKK